jgi:aminoglycoside phosphotransferase (APT) family kinase protein
MKHTLPEISNIPDSVHWRKIEFLDKGWSSDRKYRIETDDGRTLTLRLADISQYDRKKTEYERMSLIYNLGVNMSQPVDFGVCNNGDTVYILLSWVEGKSAEDTLPGLSKQAQRELGISVGKLLKRIHSIPAPEGQPPWETRMRRKVEMKISQYRDCGYTVPDDKKMMTFINDNRESLHNRPQSLQHGDFHPGNLVITPGGTLSLIDFNRMDFGDPWEEFVRVATFTKTISASFAVGQIDGYFGGAPPESFFRLLALYSAIDAHFGILWAVPFGQDEIERSLARSRSVFEDYHGFETYVPVWYQ